MQKRGKSKGAVKKNSIGTPEYLKDDQCVDTSMFDYFMGVDPSYSATGIVILDKHGEVIAATALKAGSPSERFSVRLNKLLNSLEDYLKLIDVSKLYVVMEGASFASEFNAFKLGKLSGVLEYYFGQKDIKYSLVAPTFAKKVATGKGAANKNEVIAGVRYRWGFVSNSSDVNDAYVMARIAIGDRVL